MKLPLIAIAGPTATGKSALGAALAHALNGEVVSCDSMQVYRGLETGTAQPTQAERALAPHHLTGFLDWDQEFSVSDYVAAAAEVIRDVHSRKKLPFLVGGTGLYARSLLRGFTFQPEARDEALRKSLYKEAQGLGPEALHARLATLDPQSAEEIHPHNVKRVLRALEYCLLSGEPFSRQAERSAQAEPPYRSLLFCTAFQDRQALYQRIDRRVDRMLEEGLLDEAEAFYRYCQQAEKLPTAAQSIGYKELFPYFAGKAALEEAVENVKRESRRYAKRQITWFGREPEARFLYMDRLGSVEAALEYCWKVLREENFVGEGGGVIGF